MEFLTSANWSSGKRLEAFAGTRYIPRRAYRGA